MSSQHRPGAIRLPHGLLAAAVFGTGLLCTVAIYKMRAHPALHDNTPITIAPASIRDVQIPTSQIESQARPIRIEVDATRSCSPTPEMWRTLLRDIEGLTPPSDGTQPTQNKVSANIDSLGKWAHFDATPAPINVGNAAAPENLTLYALHSKAGATFCISNRQANDAPVQLHIRLSKAPYKIERLALLPSKAAETALASARDRLPDRSIAPNTEWRLTRLKGRDLTTAGSIDVPLTVQSGELLIVRFTDTAYASRCALNEVRDQWKQLPKESSDLSSRLHVIFEGNDSCENAVSASSNWSADRRRSDIHRYLLVLGQAYALQKNFLKRNSDRPGPGAGLLKAMDRLNDALADTSATLLGLVPGVTISTAPPASSPASTAKLETGQNGSDEPIHTVYATVTLSNEGAYTTDHVKIGIDQAMLPSGVQCDPGEPAFFGTLAPAQTARATYLLKWQGTDNPLRNGLTGDISYFTAGSPAHLRPSAW